MIRRFSSETFASFVGALVVLSSGCGSSGASSSDQPYVPSQLRFVAASGQLQVSSPIAACPDATAMSVRVDGASFGTTLTPPTKSIVSSSITDLQTPRIAVAAATDYQPVGPGTHTVSVLCAGTALGAVKTVSFLPGESYTIVLAGTNDEYTPALDLQMMCFADGAVAPGTVRVYHVAPDNAPTSIDVGVIDVTTKIAKSLGSVRFVAGLPFGAPPPVAQLPTDAAPTLQLQTGGVTTFAAPAAFASSAKTLAFYVGQGTMPLSPPNAFDPGDDVISPRALDPLDTSNRFPFGREDTLSLFITDETPTFPVSGNPFRPSYPEVVGVLQ